MWTKGAFCKFSSTFLKSVEKRILAYIYIYLFLYLPICLFTYNNSRFSLFAYVCNNRMSKSSTAIYSFWPLPHCLKKSHLNVCSNYCSKLWKLSRKRSLAFEKILLRFWWLMICLGYVVTLKRKSANKTFILGGF